MRLTIGLDILRLINELFIKKCLNKFNPFTKFILLTQID